MKDFDVCIGTGDIPTPDYSDEHINCVEYWIDEDKMKAKGFIKDSTGKWYDPNNYIDAYYADW